MEGDVSKYVQEHEDDSLATQFEKLNTAVRAFNQAAANTAIIDITQILSPGHMLGGSRDISQARSESMHSAATEGKASAAMWMIGQNHAKDIDNAFPKREYVLLDDKNMDREIESKVKLPQ